MPAARAPATLLATEVQVGGRPQRAIGQLAPQRLIDADAVAAPRAQQKRFCHHPTRRSRIGASRDGLHCTPRRTQPIRGSPPAFCGRLLKRFVSAPVRTLQRALPAADDCLGVLPPSPRLRHHAAPLPPTRSERAPAEASVPTAPRLACSRDRRLQTADGRRWKARRRTVRRNALDPPSEVETPANPGASSARAPVAARAECTPQTAASHFRKPGTRRTDRDQRLRILAM